jgi:hypothetical protein
MTNHKVTFNEVVIAVFLLVSLFAILALSMDKEAKIITTIAGSY